MWIWKIKEIKDLVELEKLVKKYSNMLILDRDYRFVGECWNLDISELSYCIGNVKCRLVNLDVYKIIRASVIDFKNEFRYVFKRSVI